MTKTGIIYHIDDLKYYDDWIKLIESKGRILSDTHNPAGALGDKILRQNYEFVKQKMIYEYKLIMVVEDKGKYLMLTRAGDRVANIGMANYVKELKYKDGLEIENLKSNIETAKKARTLSIIALVAAVVAPILASLLTCFVNCDNTNTLENKNNNNPKNYSQNLFISSDSITSDSMIDNSVNISNEFSHD